MIIILIHTITFHIQLTAMMKENPAFGELKDT